MVVGMGDGGCGGGGLSPEELSLEVGPPKLTGPGLTQHCCCFET